MIKFYKRFLLLLGVVSLAIIFKNYDITDRTFIEEKYLEHKALSEKYGDLSYDELAKLDRRDRPDLAFLQRFEMTMDPALGYPPVRRKLEAYNMVKEMQAKRKDEPAAIDNVQWVERGPNNVAGRTRAVMFDPNDASAKKVWAGAVGGGLWYNMDITDERVQWQPVNDMMSNLAISTIAYDPSNTQVFYMGTGLGYSSQIQGEGIWKSNDAGATWSQLASTDRTAFQFVQKIVVLSDGVVLANTLSGTWRSTNGGDTWGSVISGRMSDIEIASDGTIYSTQGVNSAGAIFKSTDNGINWTDITPSSQTDPTRIEIVSAPSNPNRLYAVADGGTASTDVAWFMKSEDAGETWTDVTIPLQTEQDCSIGTNHFTRGQAGFDLISLIHPENPDVLLVGGIDIHRSLDAGATWELVSYWTGSFCDDLVHADQHEMVSRPGYPEQAIFGNDGGVYYSKDVFNTSSNPDFMARNNGYNVTTFYACATSNVVNSNYFLAGAQDNGTQKLTEAGLGSSVEVTGGDGAFCFIDQDNSDLQITSFIFNSYRLSLNGGLSFTAISDEQNKGRFINPSEYDSEADILYGAAAVDEISRIANLTAADPTQEFIAVSLSGRQITTIKASPHTANRLFVGVRISGGEGLLFRIDNADSATPSVSEITGTYTGSHGGWVSSIDVGTSDDQLLATFSNYGVSSVYETTDGGLNWTDKNDNLPDIPVNWGLYNPKDTKQVLLATEMGVWSTSDITAANPGWEPTNSGLANVRCDMLKYRAADETVVVATWGRGVFTTNVFASTIDADFKTNQIVGYVGIPVEFEDASLLPNDSWSWDFGDGNTSTMQNPSNTYAAAGTYDIALSINGGANTDTKAGYVTILPVKSTPYAPADGGDFESNPADYTSRPLLNGVNHWERGVPGNRLTTVSSGTNAWKTVLDGDIEDLGYDYSSALYTPAFNISDVNKVYTLKFKKSMENGYCNSPHGMQVNYSLDGGKTWYTLGTGSNDVGSVNWYNRSDASGCSINSSLFEDKIGWSASNLTTNGNTSDNSVDNENTEYNLRDFAGESNISFRFVSAVNSGSTGDDNGSVYARDGFMIDDVEITVEDPKADFGVSNSVAFIGQELQFTYQSNGATAFAWDFGDGSTSDLENPTHSYSAPGLFTVSLTITSPAGNATETKADFIQIIANREIPYLASDGGNFDVNQSDFGVENIAGTPFELGSSSVDGKDGTASGDFAWVTGLTEDEYVDDSEARLFSPVFAFNSAGTYTLKFKSKHKFEDNWDGFIVQYSTDLGDSWTKLNDNQEDNWYNQISDPQSVFGASVPIFSGNTNGDFTEFFTDVSFLYPNQNVIFRFLFLTDAATTDVGMALDDFELDGPVPGPAVPDFTFEGDTGCDGQVITFTNTSTGTISALSWDFGVNADPATATGIGPHDVTYSGTGSSTVTLTVESSVNGTQVETKTDIVSSATAHTPTFTAESSEVYVTVLTASDGDSYQWYQNGEAITTDGTSQVYQATSVGSYQVEVSINGCVGLSSTEQVTILSIEDDLLSKSISVYPNPAQNKITIAISNEETGEMQLNVYNLLGSKMISKNLLKKSSESNMTVDVSELSYGTYLFEIVSEKARATKRVVIN